MLSAFGVEHIAKVDAEQAFRLGRSFARRQGGAKLMQRANNLGHNIERKALKPQLHEVENQKAKGALRQKYDVAADRQSQGLKASPPKKHGGLISVSKSAFGVEHYGISKGQKVDDFKHGYRHGHGNAQRATGFYGNRRHAVKQAVRVARTNDDTYNRYTSLPTKSYVAGAAVGATKGAAISPKHLKARKAVVNALGFNSHDMRVSPDKPGEGIRENRGSSGVMRRYLKTHPPQPSDDV